MRRLTLFVLAVSPAAVAQNPEIRAIRNAATQIEQAADSGTSALIAGGSIISIIGSDLSASAETAPGTPLPYTLAGTSVTIGGTRAPLLFVSPTQINAIVPNALGIILGPTGVPRSTFRDLSVIVTSAESTSSPFSLRISHFGLGAFTQDGSGCGQGLIYETLSDGRVVLNGRNNSANPGTSVLTILGTGAGHVFAGPSVDLGFPPLPPEEEATPERGYRTTLGPSVVIAENPRPYNQLSEGSTDRAAQAGRAPGLVGVDRRTFTLPTNIPEGCAVPVRMLSEHYVSQNVTMAVRKGGGACVDPPVTSIAVVTWERTVTSGLLPTETTHDLRIDFLAGLGKSLPVRFNIPADSPKQFFVEVEGPSCPMPTEQRLDAGDIVASGPGWGPTPVPRDESGAYILPLPPGSLQGGAFTVKSAGGADIGPFETTLILPAPIQPSEYPPGTAIPAYNRVGGPARFTWQGGSEGSWVRVGVMSRPHFISRGDWLWEIDSPAPTGFARFLLADFFGLPVSPEAEVIFTQEPMEPVRFTAPGLSGGGLHRYIYRWKKIGLRVIGGTDFY